VSAERQYSVIPTSTVGILPKEARLNEGAVDPAGRFLAGTMGKEFGSHNGRMWSLRPATDGKGWNAPLVLENITCTNGMAWADGGKKM
jgi:sugar lactone lactonase YvrE